MRKLQKEQETNKLKLRSALKKVRKLGRAYKSKLASRMRKMKTKLAEAQASTYTRVAKNLEHQILKGIEAKSKALASAVAKIEKEHAAKLKKNVTKKGKKSTTAKKSKISSVSLKKKRGRLRKK